MAIGRIEGTSTIGNLQPTLHQRATKAGLDISRSSLVSLQEPARAGFADDCHAVADGFFSFGGAAVNVVWSLFTWPYRAVVDLFKWLTGGKAVTKGEGAGESEKSKGSPSTFGTVEKRMGSPAHAETDKILKKYESLKEGDKVKFQEVLSALGKGETRDPSVIMDSRASKLTQPERMLVHTAAEMYDSMEELSKLGQRFKDVTEVALAGIENRTSDGMSAIRDLEASEKAFKKLPKSVKDQVNGLMANYEPKEGEILPGVLKRGNHTAQLHLIRANVMGHVMLHLAEHNYHVTPIALHGSVQAMRDAFRENSHSFAAIFREATPAVQALFSGAIALQLGVRDSERAKTYIAGELKVAGKLVRTSEQILFRTLQFFAGHAYTQLHSDTHVEGDRASLDDEDAFEYVEHLSGSNFHGHFDQSRGVTMGLPVDGGVVGPMKTVGHTGQEHQENEAQAAS